jgi:hypothetical protein
MENEGILISFNSAVKSILHLLEIVPTSDSDSKCQLLLNSGHFVATSLYFQIYIPSECAVLFNLSDINYTTQKFVASVELLTAIQDTFDSISTHTSTCLFIDEKLTYMQMMDVEHQSVGKKVSLLYSEIKFPISNLLSIQTRTSADDIILKQIDCDYLLQFATILGSDCDLITFTLNQDHTSTVLCEKKSDQSFCKLSLVHNKRFVSLASQTTKTSSSLCYKFSFTKLLHAVYCLHVQIGNENLYLEFAETHLLMSNKAARNDYKSPSRVNTITIPITYQ